MDIVAKSIEYDLIKDRWIVHTGLHFELPQHYEMEIRPRSSNTKYDVYIPNTPGTLDAGYVANYLLYSNVEMLPLFKKEILLMIYFLTILEIEFAKFLFVVVKKFIGMKLIISKI